MFHFWQMLLAQLEGERERAENMEIQKLKLELQIERDRAAKLEADLSDQSNRVEEQARQSRLHMVDTELETAKLEVRTSIVDLKLPHTHSNLRRPPQCLMHDCLKKIP